MRGLTECGVDVVDIGVVPTPLLYWALHHEPVVGGIQITGSHNPPEYNGFKMCVGTGSLHGAEIQALHELHRGRRASRRGTGTVTHVDGHRPLRDGHRRAHRPARRADGSR